MITDVHARHFSPELLRFLADAKIPLAPAGARRTRSPVPMLPFEARLPMMAEAGVGRQILSSALSTRFGGNSAAVFFDLAKPVRTPLIGWPRQP